jgi:hypothetical protein
LCTLFALFAAMSIVSPRFEVSANQQSATPDVPAPSECAREPRPIPSPPPTSETSPSPSPDQSIILSGPQVPEETVAAITEVVRGSIACSNAGDILRALAYFSDDYVEQMFSGPNGVDYTGFLEYVATPPAAVPEDQRLAIVEISNVELLKDGSVGATVITGDPSNPFVDYLIFVNEKGQWLIAAAIPSTVVYATPAP